MSLLIAGIDPGTHSACALLNLEGQLVHLFSNSNGSRDAIVASMRGKGKVFLVGCDVNSVPVGVQKIASAIGARITKPEQNLGAAEKVKIVDAFLKKQSSFVKLENRHEKDALASALYAHRKIKNLINKINQSLKQFGVEERREEIFYSVLVEEIPISEAIQL